MRGFQKVSYETWLRDSSPIINYFKTRFRILQAAEENVWSFPNELFLDALSLPKRATAHSAGYDVFSPFSFELSPGEEIKIPTGFKAYMLPDEFLMFLPRSGLGFKFYARLANTVGIGDSDYYNNPGNEGHYFVKMRNESKCETMKINVGDAIVQAIFQKYLLVDGDRYDGRIREGGLGSTG